jgi:hypothetical protein
MTHSKNISSWVCGEIKSLYRQKKLKILIDDPYTSDSNKRMFKESLGDEQKNFVNNSISSSLRLGSQNNINCPSESNGQTAHPPTEQLDAQPQTKGKRYQQRKKKPQSL